MATIVWLMLFREIIVVYSENRTKPETYSVSKMQS